MDTFKIDQDSAVLASLSGVLSSTISGLSDTDKSVEDSKEWGKLEVYQLIVRIVTDKEYKVSKEDITGLISVLDKKYTINADKLINSFKTGILLSVLSELSGFGFEADKEGKLIVTDIPGWKKKGVAESIYSGTVKWFFRKAEDMDDSGEIGKEDKTGIPGPIESLLKGLSSNPLAKEIAVQNKEGKIKFEFKKDSEDGEDEGDTKNIAILFCEGIACAFYSIRKFINDVKNEKLTIDDVRNIDFDEFLPKESKLLKHLKKIASFSFSAIDISNAAHKAYVANRDDKKKFAVDFIAELKKTGLVSFAFDWVDEKFEAAEKIYNKYNTLFENMQKDIAKKVSDVYMRSSKAFSVVTGITDPNGFISAAEYVYNEMATAIEEYNIAKERRIRIEKECEEAIAYLREYRAEMESVVSEYMMDRLRVFGTAMDKMEEAIRNDDTDRFIEGNNMIQEKLGANTVFSSQDEFDLLMDSDEDFKF